MTAFAWAKSRHSNPNGACIEVGGWRKASYSNSQGACLEAASFRRSRSCESGQCAEVGTAPGLVAVRDTVQEGDPGRVTLTFSAASWKAFTRSLRNV
jgi:hypothetical protein